jgi:hypothetical protein
MFTKPIYYESKLDWASCSYELVYILLLKLLSTFFSTPNLTVSLIKKVKPLNLSEHTLALRKEEVLYAIKKLGSLWAYVASNTNVTKLPGL